MSFALKILCHSVLKGDGKTADSNNVVNAADVVLYGLDIIVPFMNAELLKVSIFSHCVFGAVNCSLKF